MYLEFKLIGIIAEPGEWMAETQGREWAEGPINFVSKMETQKRLDPEVETSGRARGRAL